MSTPFVSDYLKAAADSSDRPVDPAADPGTSEEMIAFRFEADTQTLVFWDPVNEEYLTISLGGASLTDTDDLAEGVTNLYYTDARADARAAAAIVTHAALPDPHPGYLTAAEGNAAYAAISVTQYTDELAQDAVGGILTTNSFMTLTYSDGTPSIVADPKFFGCKVRKSVNETTANYTTDTALSFDSEDFDVGGFHAGGAPTRMTVPAGGAGYYLIIGQIVTDLDTADRWHNLYLVLDSTTTIGENVLNEGGFSLYSAQVMAIVSLTAGQYVELVYKTENDASITVTTASFLSIHRIGG